MGTPNSTFSTTPQPTNSYTGLATGILPTQSNVLSGYTLGKTGLLEQHQPTTPVVSKTDSQGNTVKFAPVATDTSKTGSATPSTNSASTAKAPDDPSNQYRTDNGQPNTNWVNYKAPPALTVAGQSPGVLATGSQTPQEKQTYSGLLGQSQDSSQAYKDATDQYNQTRQQLADLQLAEKETIANVNGQGISLDSSRGQGANYAQMYAGKEAALGAQEQAASNIINAANTQQGLQVQAGTAANTAAQTQAGRATGAAENVLGNVAPMANTPYALNPGTGTYTGSGTSAGTSALDAVKNAGMLSGAQSGAAATAAAPGQTTAQNIITGGTAAVNAGAAAYAANNPAYAKLAYQTVPNIEGFGNLLMQSTGGINPFDAQYANMTLQQFQSQLSSPAQAAFQTTFQQLKKSIAELAGSGGSQTPTANSSQADNTLSSTSKLSTIQSTLQRIALEGKQYLTTAAVLSNANLNQAQGGGNSGGSFTEGTKSSDGSLIYKGGKWVKA
jgi:hypothetical protein